MYLGYETEKKAHIICWLTLPHRFSYVNWAGSTFIFYGKDFLKVSKPVIHTI